MKYAKTLVLAVGTGLVFSLASEGFAAEMAMHAKMQKMHSRAFLHGYNLPSSGVALEGYCPVAYIEANKAIRGKKEYAATYNDVTYYFVSADAMKLFQANPEKYLPAYGGWCATGMAMKQRFPVDPTSFKVVDGRLFLFLTNKNVDAKNLWNQGNEREQIAKADAFWKASNN